MDKRLRRKYNLMPQLLEAVQLLKDMDSLLYAVLDSTCYELDAGQQEIVDAVAQLQEKLSG